MGVSLGVPAWSGHQFGFRRKYGGPITYYVDATTGNDDNTGTSPAAPWETIAKVNAASLAPGDSVLFKRGETWSGTDWIVALSGTAGHYITFGAYGTGDRPIIVGQNHAEQTLKADEQSYLWFEHLDIAGSALSNYAAYFDDCHHIVLDDCLARDAHAWFGIGFNDSGAGKTHHITVNGCTISGNHATGLVVQYANAGPTIAGPTDVTITDNVLHTNGTTASADHGMYLRDVRSGVVTGNIAYGNPVGAGIKLNTCTGLVVSGNHCYQNKWGVFLGAEYALTSTAQVVNNVLDHNTVHGLAVVANMNGGTVAHNTIVNNVSKGIDLANEVSGWTFKNNIVLQSSADGCNAYSSFCVNLVASSNNLANNTWDNNCHVYLGDWPSDTTLFQIGSTTYTLAQWKLLTGSPEAHGIGTNPTFVTDYSNFHLQAGSPCIGTGDATVGITTDYDGVARGVAVDIGAYECVA